MPHYFVTVSNTAAMFSIVTICELVLRVEPKYLLRVATCGSLSCISIDLLGFASKMSVFTVVANGFVSIEVTSSSQYKYEMAPGKNHSKIDPATAIVVMIVIKSLPMPIKCCF